MAFVSVSLSPVDNARPDSSHPLSVSTRAAAHAVAVGSSLNLLLSCSKLSATGQQPFLADSIGLRHVSSSAVECTSDRDA